MKNWIYSEILRNNAGLCVTLLWLLTALPGLAGLPPVIKPTSSLSSQAAFASSNATFSVTATGDSPLWYQWLKDGQELPGQTNRVLDLKALRAEDDAEYEVMVTNASGTALSYPVHLHVVPPSSSLAWGNFTNAANARLPYRYYLPPDYDPARQYPLILQLHGSSSPAIDESTFATYFPAQFYSHTSYGRQATEPTIVLYPTRRRGDGTWTDAYVKLMAEFLDEAGVRWSIDTNRIYVIGTSEGVHAAWDLLGQRPNSFAGAGMAAGWKGTTAPEIIRPIPLWVWQAADDADVSISNSRLLVRALRQACGHPIYTEFQTGGHVGGMGAGLLCPALYRWIMEQRRGSTAQIGPLLSIVPPAGTGLITTAAVTVDLNGTAEGYTTPVSRVSWENLTTGMRADAAGTNDWQVTGIPLKPGVTNVVVVTATMASGVPPNGGSTSASDTRPFLCRPIQATFVANQSKAMLEWTGGTGPFRVQRAADLNQGNWQDLNTNATSPIILDLDGPSGFYRIVGQ